MIVTGSGRLYSAKTIIVCALLAFCGLQGMESPAHGAERVVVRAGLHAAFGRMVFDWTIKVDHRLSVKGRSLTIQFDTPVEPVLSGVQRSLKPYVSSIRRGSDPRTVQVTLIKPFKVRSSTVGNHVVVDLLKSDPPAPNSQKRTSAKKTASVPGVKLPPPTRLGPRTAVKKTRASKTAPKQTVAKVGQPKGASSKSRQPAAADAVSVRTGHHANYGRLVFGWPRKVGFNVERQGPTVTILFNAPAKVDIAALRRQLPSQISAALMRPNTRGLEIGLVVPPGAQLRYFHNNNDIVFDVVTRKKKAKLKTAAKTADKGAKGNKKALEPRRSKKGKKSRKTKRQRPPTFPFVSVDASRQGKNSRLKFNWRKPVNAAAFRRGTSFWIVFDRPARLDIGPIRVIGGGTFRSAEQFSDGNAVSIRLPLGGNLQATVRREGTVWIVETAPERSRAIRNFPLSVRKGADQGAELVIKVSKPGRITPVRDKLIGDSVVAIPAAATGIGILPLRRFPEFELLSSVQGVAIRPFDDRIRVRTTDDAVIISRSGGLSISPDVIAAAGTKRKGEQKRLLDLVNWRYGASKDFQKIEHDLVKYVTQPKGVRRNAARLGLARFYVSHGMGAEALGVLDVLLQEDPQVLRDPGVRALRGVANYQFAHYAEADADLAHPTLAGVRELFPWRAGIAAARGDWAGANRLFADTEAVISALPSEFTVDLGLLAAEAALSVKNKDVAEARLGALETLPAVGRQLDQLAYLKGHLLKQQGDYEKALEIWKPIADSGARPSRAKAAFSMVIAALENGDIEAAEAIKRLEAMKFAWRNSVFEFDLLTKLGELYASRRNLRDALVTLRKAVTLFKNIKGSQALTQKMRDMFRKFYLDGEADHLEPVVALGLYNEFRELTPTDSSGDKMIRRLSERLIDVDLLAEAAQLLDHQVKFRLKGEEKARTGARLAEILLFDGKPLEALAALRNSENDKLPPKVLQRRRHLQASGLMDAKKYQQALDNISNDFTEEFDFLRAQIFWRAGQWPKASRVLARLTGGVDPSKLSDRDAELLLRRSVALGLAGDREGMAFLRARFGAAMEKSARAAAFKAVAGGKLLDPKDFAALARQAAELETFRAFMDSLQSKPKPKPKRPDQTASLN
jgi:tetratricopeptide (TPR) repeat protein